MLDFSMLSGAFSCFFGGGKPGKTGQTPAENRRFKAHPGALRVCLGVSARGKNGVYVPREIFRRVAH